MGALSRWPEHTGIGAIGDVGTARRYADVVRRELTAMGIRVYLGPMADIFSEPRWSRGFGTFGEDPDAVARLTAAFIEGLRGSDELGPRSVAAVVKHFPGAGPQKDGLDAHDRRFREQVYPGDARGIHLRPFEAAFAAGVTQVMPYYGMPVGTDWAELGFAFNGPVIGDLLRGHYGFTGIVCSDWWVVGSTRLHGIDFGPNGYGLEHLTPKERMRIALDVGVDQFGGDHCPELAVELVQDGAVPESRIDESARRLLAEKFRLGLFDERRVDVDRAIAVAGSGEHVQQGRAAQGASLTLLTNEPTGGPSGLLPLRPGIRVYAEGVGADFPDALRPYGSSVNTLESADVVLLRLDAPWETSGDRLEQWFHSGSLEFPADVVEHVLESARHKPTVLVVYLERPAVLTPFVGEVAAVIGDFGSSDAVLLRALFGDAAFTGRLPFDLPSSMTAVRSSREDVPFDTDRPLFRCADGLHLPARRDRGTS
jgi:beta-glucosidase